MAALSPEDIQRDTARIAAELLGLPGGTDPFAAAARATRMPMVITNPRLPDNPIVFVNDSFCRLSGCPRAEILNRNCRFLQCAETDSKSAIEPLTPTMPGYSPEEAKRRHRGLRSVHAIVNREARLHGGAPVLVVAQKAVKEALSEHGPMAPCIDLAYHNAVAGRDQWRNVRAVIVVGRTQPAPASVERMAEALTGRAVERLDGWYQRGDGVRHAAGEAVAIEADRHPDPTCELSLLLSSPTPPLPDEPPPLSVDLVAEQGPAAALGLPAPAEATAAPPTPVAAVEQPETPPPAPMPPAVEAPPPIQQAEVTPPAPLPESPAPPPVQQVETPPPTPVPDELPPPPPPSPVQPANPPPPVPPPAPTPPTPPLPPSLPAPPKPMVQTRRPPSPPLVQVRPSSTPPQRAAARPTANQAPDSQVGSPARGTEGQSAAGRAGSANNGAAWGGKLNQWWNQHSYYPRELSQTNEGGTVRLHIVIASDGQITLVAVVQSSGSSVLDAAAVAVFRNARLPPFPPDTPALPDATVTLHYRPADNGG